MASLTNELTQTSSNQDINENALGLKKLELEKSIKSIIDQKDLQLASLVNKGNKLNETSNSIFARINFPKKKSHKKITIVVLVIAISLIITGIIIGIIIRLAK